MSVPKDQSSSALTGAVAAEDWASEDLLTPEVLAEFHRASEQLLAPFKRLRLSRTRSLRLSEPHGHANTRTTIQD